MTDSRATPFVDAVRKLGGTVLSLAETRLQLLSVEWEEERARLARIWILAAVALFLAGVGVVLACALLVVLLWDDYRVATLVVLTVLFLAGAIVAGRAASRALAQKPKLFASSLAALRRDREAVQGDHAP